MSEKRVSVLDSLRFSTPKAAADGERVDSLRLACHWLTQRCANRSSQLPPHENPGGYPYANWQGAMREYDGRIGRWLVFGPLWHTGQAVKALVRAWEVLGDEQLLETARTSAAFIFRAQREDGLIVAFENADRDSSATSCMLEALDGLLVLSEVTGDLRYQDAALKALRWAADNVFLPDEGLFLDDFDLRENRARSAPNTLRYGVPGRPLLDDGVFLRGWRLSGDRRLRDIFFAAARRLLRDESPPGNWINFPPCHPQVGIFHPRHAFWWGRPMVMAWRENGDERYLACAKRCADWYVRAQRTDGGMFRGTDRHFNTPTFGHATSGILAAACLWNDLIAVGEGEAYREPLANALAFGHSMQFKRTADPNLTGAILEKICAPDGTDRPPYFVRDLGTIFYIQALCGAPTAMGR